MAPPSKASRPTPETKATLESWLLSITAFRVETAGKPWTSYEELDRYLGPWGAIGYPIAYGKKYCVLFGSDARLNADPVGRGWIRRTLLLLQDELRGYVLARYSAGTLAATTATELRDFAFSTHPKAYTEGGLTMVVMLTLELPNASLEVMARELITAIAVRRAVVLRRYQREGRADPALREIFRMFDAVAP